MEAKNFIKWFSELHNTDTALVGGKGASLGEMYNAKFPIPPGFVITSEAYSHFLDKTGLKQEIYDLLNKVDINNLKELDEASIKIKQLIINAKMPSDLQEEIYESYDALNVDKESYKNASKNVLSILKMSDPKFVAVRSSATAEDSSEASFAGQQESFLNIKGKENVVEAIKKCLASLFTARSIYYRTKKGFKHENVLIAVVIQEMIDSAKSGVIFTRDPISGQENIIIEAVFGLGEGIVSGRIKPDHYEVSRELKIIKSEISKKNIAVSRDSSGKTGDVKLTEEKSTQQVLSEYEIKRLADYAIKIEEHYKSPQDIEFAVDSHGIFVVQSRPITTINKLKKQEKQLNAKSILNGSPASPGIATGEVKIIKSMQDLEKIKKGDVLVTEMTNPDMVVSMQKSAAIITDEGGMTSHAAIVSREMGIPAIVGTKNATSILKDGQIVTVDGFNGKIYDGKPSEIKETHVEILPIVQTKTKIKVIVDLPDFAERASKTGIKEVGLTRLEGLIAEAGKHPFYFLRQGKIQEYEDMLYEGINKIAKYFDKLWIRTSDIRTDEFRNLQGSVAEVEGNPMLGMHGIRFSLKNKEILKAELKAMKRTGKDIGIILPQVISIDEVRQGKEILKEINAKLSLGVIIETPAAVEIIESLCEEGIAFISFGTNDLTQYTLAIDRNNEEVQYLYDEMHPAVLSQLKRVIDICKKYNVETSICGQAGSNKKMVEFLVKSGIDGISVNADKAKEISEFVLSLEGEKREEIKKEKQEEKREFKEEIKKNITIENKKQVYSVKCFDCDNETEVPFKPDNIRPVFCKECFQKRKDAKKQENTRKPEEIKEERIEEKPVENKIEETEKRIEEEYSEEPAQKKDKPGFYEEESEKIIESQEDDILDIF